MTNSLGFGGHNASLIFRRYRPASGSTARLRRPPRPSRWRLRDPYARLERHRAVSPSRRHRARRPRHHHPRRRPTSSTSPISRPTTTRSNCPACTKRSNARDVQSPTGETIALFGDFDVDGVTSIAVLQLGLRPLGAKTVNYIPDRFAEGYGLNFGAVRRLRADGAGLLMTADCGISSVDEVALRERARPRRHHPQPPHRPGRDARRRRRRQPQAARFALPVRRAGRRRRRLPLPPGALRSWAARSTNRSSSISSPSARSSMSRRSSTRTAAS